MTTSEAIAGANPFVGPRPLETGQRIFGRERETEELYYLLSAERIVLLHAPSGAGKSSLIHAALVPRLQQHFDVRGPTRVNTTTPPGMDVNRYVHSANIGFEQDLPEAHRRPEEVIARMSLGECVKSRPRKRSAPQNLVLIFDQFEEILTADPLAIAAKHEFFRQLGVLLQDQGVWALFAMRDDYLAQLDPYASHLPTHLKNRLRVDLLGRDAAMSAMQGTAQLGGRSFTDDAVAQMVTDLATVQVQQSDGRFEPQVGPHVEPLHLQVVCRGLWDHMPENDQAISPQDLASFGDVTRALARYYEDVMGKLGDSQRAAREWVGDKLITANGIRCQVLKGMGSSEGLDNQLIAQLVDAHLVRSEQHSGAIWYELAHDRLVAPVRNANAHWFDAHLSPVQKTVSLWEAQDRPAGLLLLGEALRSAQDWAAGQAALTEAEREFLEASRAKQAAADKELRQARRLRWLATASTVVSVLAFVGGVYIAWQYAALQELSEKSERLSAERDELARQLAAQLTIAEGSAGPRSTPWTKEASSTEPFRALSDADLASIMPDSTEKGRAKFLQPLNAAMAEFAINTPLRQAHFLAQVAFETVSLRLVQEIWNPAAASWQARYEGRRDLGNTEPGDGQRYLGRGVFQLVGRANYKQYGEALGLDLVSMPERAAEPDVAVRTGAIFWKLSGLNKLADADDARAITQRISGNTNSLGERLKAVNRAKARLLPL
jgi:predicted chitinase